MKIKTLLPFFFVQNTHFKESFRIMKISLFLLFASFFQLMAINTEAQNAIVKIETGTLTVGQLINQIEKQTDYLIVFRNKEVDTEHIINTQRKSGKIVSYLEDAFNGTDITYEFDNKYILLLKKNSTVKPTPLGKQNRKITGMVTDNNGESIIGANVVVKGTTTGTVTDLNGKYVLEVPLGAILQVSFIGYLTEEVVVNNKKTADIKLIEDTQSLDEVVVVGYGTQKKGEVASAISSIKSGDFTQGSSTADAAQLIRGKVAGLSIVSPDANPTSTSQIMLRGITTLKASANPLILIDGIPGSLNTVSPEDIEQIDVLKDGSAAAIYGTRGTNGVILITTKSAKGEMPTTVDVNAYVSTQQIIKKLPFMTADEYRQLVQTGKPNLQDNGATVNWLDEVLRTPLTQVYNISLRGGSKKTNYIASFEYRDMNGIIKKSDNKLIYPRIEINHRMFDDKLRITMSVNGSVQSNFAGLNASLYRNALTYNPTTPIKDDKGNWSESPSTSSYANPLALLNEAEGENKATNFRYFGTAVYSPIKNLDIKYLYSSDTYNQTRGYYETQKHISTVANGRNGVATRGTSRRTEEISELTVQYSNTIAKHHNFNALLGYSWLKSNYQNYDMSNFGFPSDDYTYNNMELGQALKDGRATLASYQSENKLIGYFGRLNYNFDGKYMISASMRYEGSTKFGVNHKWGTFPAISGAWNMKEENFLKDVNVLSALKFRVGFGITGTEPTDPYMSVNLLDFRNYAYFDGEWMKVIKEGKGVNPNSNPDLQWEKKKEFNIGIDFGFFDNKLYGTVDFYNRTTNELLWDYKVPTPPYMYPDMVANAGSMRNQGIEVSLTYHAIDTKDFQWVTSANYSTNRNKLLSLSNGKFVTSSYAEAGSTGEPIQQATHRLEEGKPIGNFYGFKSIDIDDNGYWIIEGKDGKPKSIALQQPDDKQVLGNGLPKHYLNWNNKFSYKNWDLTITMRGAFGFQILNMSALHYGSPVMLGRGNVLNTAYDNVYGKRSLASDQSLQYVSHYIEDGDYWKIDNLTLGYMFNLKKAWLKSLRLYATVSNLAIFTGYKGLDPEVSIAGLNPGNDFKDRYPSARTFTLGTSIKF